MTPTPHFPTDAWVQTLGWTLIQFLWQGTVLALVYAAARLLLRRWAGPRMRYTMACVTFGLMVAAPPLTFIARGHDASASPWQLSTPELWRAALPWVVALWFAGVVAFSVRLIGGWRITVRLRKIGVRAAEPMWQPRLDDLIARMRVSRPVTLLVSSLVDVPTVVGWWTPVILMPVAALAGLPPAHVESLLAHELAHVRRFDYLINVMQRIAEAALFYHPAVWWVSNQMREERELCCDELAVATNGDLLTYVHALAELESHRPAHSTHALAANGGSLLDRMQRLAGLTPPAWQAFPGAGAVAAMSVLWAVGVGAIGVNAASTRPEAPLAIVQPATDDARLAPPTRTSTLLFGPIGPATVQLPRDTSARPAPTQQPQTTRVEGAVVSASGGAVPRASIQLITSGATLTEKGDDEGRFVFTEVPPGRYVLVASKAGFITDALGAPSPGATAPPITLEAGLPLLNAVITLTPQGVITGRVLSQEGDPLVRATVTAYRSTYVRGRKQMTSVGTSVSDDEGNYRLANLSPGRYYVGVSALTGTAADVSAEALTSASERLAATRLSASTRVAAMATMPPPDSATAYAMGYAVGAVASSPAPAKPDKRGIVDVPTFYPNSTDLAGASTLEIAPGSHLVNTDLRVRREQAFSIRGRVSMQGSAPTAAVVIAQRVDGGLVTQAASAVASQGVFEILNLAPGTYTLRVPAPGAGLSGTLDVLLAGADLNGVVIDLIPAATLNGTIAFERGEAPVVPAGTPPAVARYRVRLLPDPAGTAVTAVIKEDGTFATSTPIAPGRYLVEVMSLPDGAYIKSVSYGGMDVGRRAIDIGPTGGPLAITLSTRGASVAGMVRDEQGRPAAGVTVKLWPRVWTEWTPTLGASLATTDQNGRFQITGLPAGDYYAAGWEGEPFNSGLLGVPELLTRFAGEAATVTVAAGANATVNAPRISAAKIAAAAERLP